ncbi:MAG: hypothetical protein HYZ40_11720 [Rhodospirillales bacterium]|nr:hypothetical protein [Rhodospirillales bacterium]
MQNSMNEKFGLSQIDPRQSCGRPDCICALAPGERFILWAVRQWQCELIGWRFDPTLPRDGSALVRGFEAAGLLDTLTDFATLMDVLLFGAQRALEIHAPACSCLSRDEATLIALCGLAQGDHDGSLVAPLETLMVPRAARVAALRLRSFAEALGDAGLKLSLPSGTAAGRLN